MGEARREVPIGGLFWIGGLEGMQWPMKKMATYAAARVELNSTKHRSFARSEPNRVKQRQLAISNDGNAAVGW